MVIVHSKTKNGEKIEEEEHTPFSENLFFNIDKQEVGTPIELFITMQNIAGKVFLQRTKLFVVQRNQDKKYFLKLPLTAPENWDGKSCAAAMERKCAV